MINEHKCTGYLKRKMENVHQSPFFVHEYFLLNNERRPYPLHIFSTTFFLPIKKNIVPLRKKFKSMRVHFFLCCLTLSSNTLSGYVPPNVDSLLQIAHHKPVNKQALEANLQLFYYYEYNAVQDKKARTYLDTIQTLLEIHPDKEVEARFNRMIGSYFCLSFNFELGVTYFQKSLAYYESTGDELKIATAKFKIANHLQDIGEELGGLAASSRIDKEVLPTFIKYKDNYHYCGVLVEE